MSSNPCRGKKNSARHVGGDVRVLVVGDQRAGEGCTAWLVLRIDHTKARCGPGSVRDNVLPREATSGAQQPNSWSAMRMAIIATPSANKGST